MKPKRTATGVVLASATFAFSSLSLADGLECSYDPDPQVRRTHLVDEIRVLAYELRCKDYGETERDEYGNPKQDEYGNIIYVDDGDWTGDPIWQYKGKGSLGCVVHERLARQLDEGRSDDPDSKPPRNKHDTNDAAGAANDIENGKDDAAYTKLTSFIETILYSYADKLNQDYTGDPDADTEAKNFAYQADAARACIGGL